MNPERPALDYQKPIDPLSTSRIVGQCIGMCILTALIIIAFVFLVILAGISIEGVHGPSSAGLVTAAIASGLIVVALLNWAAYRAYQDPRRRGVALGIWLGLGIGLLVEGACFAGRLF